jgi:hypothetical protein
VQVNSQDRLLPSGDLRSGRCAVEDPKSALIAKELRVAGEGSDILFPTVIDRRQKSPVL